MVQISFYDGTVPAYVHGTGFLVNDAWSSGTPLLITARHVIDSNGDGTVESAELQRFSSHAYFSFDYVSSCTGQPGSTTSTYSGVAQGAQVLVTSVSHDAVLLRLSGIPAAARPYFLGWQVDLDLQDDAIVVHHPRGDVKKISDMLNGTGYRTAGEAGWEYYLVDYYESGVTETASSGAPLVDAYERLLLGHLKEGHAGTLYTCDELHEDVYVPFPAVYPEFASYLGSVPPTFVVPPYDPYDIQAVLEIVGDILPGQVREIVARVMVQLWPNFWAKAGSMVRIYIQ